MIVRESELAISCVRIRHMHIGDEPRDPRLMATLLGTIEQYRKGQEEWPHYVQRLEQFLQANDIVGETKANKRPSVLRLLDQVHTTCYGASWPR